MYVHVLVQFPRRGNAGSYGDSDRVSHVETSLHARNKSHLVLLMATLSNFADCVWCAAFNITGN